MSQKHRPIPVALRFDDPSPGSNHAIERAVIEMLRTHGAKATFAVIPFWHGQEGVVELRQGQLPHVEDAASDRLIEIALHGCFH